MLVVTSELIDRMLKVEIANLQSRLRHYAKLLGNPSQVSFHEFGDATAFVAARLPVRFYNSVLGVGPGTIEHLDAICELYEAYGVKPSMTCRIGVRTHLFYILVRVQCEGLGLLIVFADIGSRLWAVFCRV